MPAGVRFPDDVARRPDHPAGYLDVFMTSLFLGLPAHLVFKWRFGHLGTWRLLLAAAPCVR